MVISFFHFRGLRSVLRQPIKTNHHKGSSDPAQQTQVYARVQVLLNGHDDLLDEFRKPLFQIGSFKQNI